MTKTSDEPLDTTPEIVVDFEDDEFGLLDAEPWDTHELEKFIQEDKSFD